MLNAGGGNIHLRYDRSRVKEIGGTSITVRRKPGFLKRKAGTLSAELIEGDAIYLEYTEADIVRGKHVEIGPGCKIEKIEYQTSCKSHEKSTVQEHIQI
ncbi:YhbF [Bacillus sp. 916]|nr:YhbF [Bacillus sp. 916]